MGTVSWWSDKEGSPIGFSVPEIQITGRDPKPVIIRIETPISTSCVFFHARAAAAAKSPAADAGMEREETPTGGGGEEEEEEDLVCLDESFFVNRE